MKPDGNCFYRAISHQLFGTQEEHSIVRRVITRMERLNKWAFAACLMPEGNIDEHCTNVGTLSTWATEVEVIATATIFRVPVYFCTVSPDSTPFWSVIHPLSESKWLLHYPELPELDESIPLLRPKHFELLYYESCHYDAIVSNESGEVCLNTPVLSGGHSEMVDLTL